MYELEDGEVSCTMLPPGPKMVMKLMNLQQVYFLYKIRSATVSAWTR